MRPNFFSSGLIFSAGIAQESWRDLAAVILGAVWGGGRGGLEGVKVGKGQKRGEGDII